MASIEDDLEFAKLCAKFCLGPGAKVVGGKKDLVDIFWLMGWADWQLEVELIEKEIEERRMVYDPKQGCVRGINASDFIGDGTDTPPNINPCAEMTPLEAFAMLFSCIEEGEHYTKEPAEIVCKALGFTREDLFNEIDRQAEEFRQQMAREREERLKKQ